MKWFEYIIMIVAIGLVFLPFILKIANKKKGKPGCSSGCCCCPHRESCCKVVKKENIGKD